MNTLIINGSSKITGEVRLQGAKNATMHEILMTLIANDKFVIKNVPDISSIRNQLKIIGQQGSVTNFANNIVSVDNTNVTGPIRISRDLFFHASGGIYAVPLLTGRFGRCEVKFDFSRTDTGGDQIGRNFDRIIEIYKSCGISTAKTEFGYRFEKGSNESFLLDTVNGAWGKSQNWLLAALFRNGESKIGHYAREPEHRDYIAFLNSCGAKIGFAKDDVVVVGQKQYHGTSHLAMSDKNDFATWLFLAIANKTPIKILNANIDKEHMKPIFPVLDFWGVKLTWQDDTISVDLQNLELKPLNLIAGNYPIFHTDWQPLISPVLTQIDGVSTIIDSYHSNRMQHWKELGKMGAKFEFFTDEKYPEQDKKPRAVRIFGGTKLHGAKVNALDVRCGAGLAIAATIAEGQTKIVNTEQIDRGYQNFSGRLKNLGVSLSTSGVE